MKLDRDAVRRVIGLLKQSAAEELAIQDGETYVRAKRTGGGTAAPAEAGPETEAEPGAEPVVVQPEPHLHTVKAGLVGLFHRGRGPDTEPLVAVGDRVTEGQVIGTIEALRKLTDVVCDAEGELVEVLQEDGQPVEYGQPLFSLRLEEGQA